MLDALCVALAPKRMLCDARKCALGGQASVDPDDHAGRAQGHRKALCPGTCPGASRAVPLHAPASSFSPASSHSCLFKFFCPFALLPLRASGSCEVVRGAKRVCAARSTQTALVGWTLMR
eukprot:275319-Rhodomonas_salina.1